MSLPAPFGRYELLERIGRGGMAEVFLARAFGAAGFEKKLVIKRIRAEHARDPRFVQMFIHEAKVGVHLNHPNLVTVYELGKVGETWYIAMEWVHGPDVNRMLRALRARGERMPTPIAVRILADALRGLGYAHGLPDIGEPGVGLVHRDVSPHNLLVTYTGDVKLVDFGIARLLDRDPGVSDDETSEEVTRGSLPPPGPEGDDDAAAAPGGGKFVYMSPEQARGEAIDARSDLYSAGVVLWEMLVGDKMYRGMDAASKLRRVQEGRVPDPARRGLLLDDDLRAILDRALAPDPDDRYDSAQAFEEDLRAWLYDQDAQTGRAAVAAFVGDLFPDERREPGAGDDLRRLADDLRQLDASTASQTGSDPDVGERPAPSEPPAAGAEERKRVAAMVVDVDGFTDISERAEPEILFQRHLSMLRWLRGVLDEHGGTLQHMHDDQAYVLFGLTRTRRDDLERALACAAALQRRVTELERQGLPVHLAVGVHTGDVTVGRAGDRVRYAARGDTTRLARRLSEQADHGQVVVSDAVQRAMEGSWAFQRGPWLLGRGGRSPLPTWILGSRRPLSARSGGWLRRGDELRVLEDALRTVADGSSVTAIIQGEAGSGKSRLVAEIAGLAQRRNLPLLNARATPFGHALTPVRDLLLAAIGLESDADDAAVQGALPKLVPMGLSPRDRDHAEALLTRRRRIDALDAWHAVRRVIASLATGGPVMVVVEDIHQLSAPVVAGLARLSDGLRGCPVLLLMTCQDAIPAPLADAIVVTLGPFPRDLQARLAAERLGADALDPALEARFAESCEGNPLYIEELARYLREGRHVRVEDGVARLADDDDALPATLAGVLAARLDALDPASKGALQLAAVMGPTFRLDVLADAIGLDDPSPIVDDLAAHGLVRRTAARGVWSFASEFVRETAMRGTLGVQRRDHHRLVAAALERRLGQDPDPAMVARLAMHCGEGGRFLDAARYAYAAGREAEDAHQLERARTHYRNGLGWIQRVEETPEAYEARTQGEAMMRLRLGALCLRQGDVRPGLGSLRIALDVAEEGGLGWVAARAHLALGRHHVIAGNLAQASAHLQQAWERTVREDDVDLELEVTESRAALALAEGRTDEADAFWEAMLKRLPEDGPARRARTLAGRARVAVQAGDGPAAQRYLEAALLDARQAGDRRQEARVLEQIGRVALWDGRQDEALRRFRAALSVREDIGHERGVARGLRHLGDVHLLRGDLTRAWIHFRRSREIARDAGWRHGLALSEAYLGFIAGRRGEGDGRARIERAMAQARSLDDPETALTATWLLARLDASLGETEVALHALEDAEREARERHLDPMARLLRETAAAIRAGEDALLVSPAP